MSWSPPPRPVTTGKPDSNITNSPPALPPKSSPLPVFEAGNARGEPSNGSSSSNRNSFNLHKQPDSWTTTSLAMNPPSPAARDAFFFSPMNAPLPTLQQQKEWTGRAPAGNPAKEQPQAPAFSSMVAQPYLVDPGSGVRSQPVTAQQPERRFNYASHSAKMPTPSPSVPAASSFSAKQLPMVTSTLSASPPAQHEGPTARANGGGSSSGGFGDALKRLFSREGGGSRGSLHVFTPNAPPATSTTSNGASPPKITTDYNKINHAFALTVDGPESPLKPPSPTALLLVAGRSDTVGQNAVTPSNTYEGQPSSSAGRSRPQKLSLLTGASLPFSELGGPDGSKSALASAVSIDAMSSSAIALNYDSEDPLGESSAVKGARENDAGGDLIDLDPVPVKDAAPPPQPLSLNIAYDQEPPIISSSSPDSTQPSTNEAPPSRATSPPKQHNTDRSAEKKRRQEAEQRRREIRALLYPPHVFDFLVVVSLVAEEVEVNAAATNTFDPTSSPSLARNQRQSSSNAAAVVATTNSRRILVPKITYRFPSAEYSATASFNGPATSSAPPPQQQPPPLRSQDSTLSSTDSLEESNLPNATLLDNIPLFCFPEFGASGSDSSCTVEEYLREEKYAMDRGDTTHTSETFSFVLTDVDGSKRFGYCRRLMSDREVEGEVPVKVPIANMRVSGKNVEKKDGVPVVTTYFRKKKRLPEVHCVISPAGCFALFSQILDIVQQLRLKQGSQEGMHSFLRAVFAEPFPRPGRTISIRQPKPSLLLAQEYQLHRPVDLLNLEHVSFHQLLTCLGITSASSLSLTNTPHPPPFFTLVTLFTALLLERHVIFVSKSLQKLSDCCNAALAMMYPLEWQHVFIPILPRKLLDFVCSPTPFLIGMLPADVAQIVPGFREDVPVGMEGGPEVQAHQRKGSSSTSTQSFSNSGGSTGGGMGRREKEKVELLPMEETLVIHLDTGRILRHDTVNQDRGALPTFLIHRLKTFLEEALRMHSDDTETMSVKLPFMDKLVGSGGGAGTGSIGMAGGSKRPNAMGTNRGGAASHQDMLIPNLTAPPPLAALSSVVKQVSSASVSSTAFNTNTNNTNHSISTSFSTTPASPSKAQVQQRRNAAIGQAFMKIFLLLVGPYREYMEVEMEDPNQSPVHQQQPSRRSLPENDTTTNGPRVRVWFDAESFVNYHPLTVGHESVWLTEAALQFQPTNLPSNPASPTSSAYNSVTMPTPTTGPPTIPILSVPSSSQRAAIRELLVTLSRSQNFQCFMQAREEAFQYHYQTQLEKTTGQSSSLNSNGNGNGGGEEGESRLKKNGSLRKSKTRAPSGQKMYYSLAQSMFEKRITQIEMKIHLKLRDKVVE